MLDTRLTGLKALELHLEMGCLSSSLMSLTIPGAVVKWRDFEVLGESLMLCFQESNTNVP